MLGCGVIVSAILAPFPPAASLISIVMADRVCGANFEL